jgi:predicted TPR repeat methyltransferase
MPEPSADSRFEQAKTRFFAGLAAFEGGRFEEAEQQFSAALEAVPDRVSTLINLAATLLKLARPQDALRHADAALAREPDSSEAWLHHATALLQLGRLDDALQGFDRLLQSDSRLPTAWSLRAQALDRLGRPAEALGSYERALALNVSDAQAWSGKGSTLREMGRLDEAAQAFREALRHGGDPDVQAYYLASVENGHMSLTAPRAYVEGLFDDYADDFDAHLVGTLGYRAHAHLVQGLADLNRGPFGHALDVGCGTGLCGPLIRPMTGRLTGLDLSAGMLAKAGELGLYDQLVHADGVDYLRATGLRFDLVLAADVFIYIGDLEPMFAAVAARLERGVFCFSVEALEDGGGDFRLLPSLRYAHSQAYVQRLASEHGFELIHAQRQSVREEQRHAVPGLFVYLARVDTAGGP